MAREGDDVWDVAAAGLGAAAGGAVGRRFQKRMMRKRYMPNAGDKSYKANLRAGRENTENWEEAARSRPKEKWVKEEAVKQRRHQNKLEGKQGARGGAVAGGVGGYSVSNMVRDDRRRK